MGSVRNCLQIVKDLDGDDADAVLSALDSYRARGVDIATAQRKAVADVLASADAERADLMAAVREQHPDVFAPPKAAEAAPAPAPEPMPEAAPTARTLDRVETEKRADAQQIKEPEAPKAEEPALPPELDEVVRAAQGKPGDNGTLFSTPVNKVAAAIGKALGFDSGHLGRAVDDVERMFDATKADVNPVAHFVRTIGFSIDGQLRALERVFFKGREEGNPIAVIRRHLNADPGQGTGVSRTYGEAVNMESIAYRNRLAKALEPFAETFGDTRESAKAKKAVREQVTRLLQNRAQIKGYSPIHKAAADIAKILDDFHDYLVKSGVQVGKQADYFPRVLDDMAVMANPDGFREAARRAYEAAGVPADEARQAADAWVKQTVLGGAGVVENPFLDFANSIPKADFAKRRELTKAADRILSDYLVRDPSDVLETYIHKGVRRAEWERRFGGEVEYRDAFSGKTVKGTKYQAMRADVMRAAGDSGPRAAELVDGLVLASVGQLPGPTGRLGAGVQNAVSWGRTLTVITFLKLAAVTSLTEPILTGARTGRPVRDMVKGYASTLQDITRRVATRTLGEDIGKALSNANTEQARRIAEMIGSVENHLAASAAHVLQADGMVESSKLASKLATRATILTGLRAWTDATRIASTRVGMDFIRSMAAEAAGGGKLAARYLRELGVKDDQHAALAEWIRGGEETGLAKGGDMAEVYQTALGRFADQVIMQPKNADKPFYAAHPVASTAYTLTGYLYAYQQNVLNRAFRMAKDAAANPDGLSPKERLALLAPVMSLAMIPVAQAALIPVREWLKGTDEERRQKKRSETLKANLPFAPEVDTGVPQWMAEAVSRSGIFGAADPLLNLITNARYEKRPSSVLIGPYYGSVEQLFTDVFGRDSDNTNTQERRVAQSFYQAFVDPAVSTFAAAYLPGGTAAAVTQVAGMERTREAFKSVMAGDKPPTDPVEKRLAARMKRLDEGPEKRMERRMKALAGEDE